MSQGSLAELCRARIGSTLKGKWTLERLLGVGGMAAVYVGLHKIGRRDAIKILHPEVARSREFLARFEQEAQVANQFQHPGAVEVRDIDVSDEGCPFLVMELLEGESLGERAQRLDGISEVDLLRYVDELLDVLTAAHEKGIVHRDIKLDNLFIVSTGELKVLDFGIARMRSAPAMTRIGVRLGTTAYMPPEQVRGEEIDGRADLFAVGATMFRLIARRRIHEAPTDGEMLEKMSTLPAPSLREAAPATEERLAMIVDRALAFRKHERYPDAQTMQADVRALRQGLVPPYASAAANGAVAPVSIAMGGDRVASSAFAMEATGVETSTSFDSALGVANSDPTRMERRGALSTPPQQRTQLLAIPRPDPRTATPESTQSSSAPRVVPPPSTPPPGVAAQRGQPTNAERPQSQSRSEPPVSLSQSLPPQSMSAQNSGAQSFGPHPQSFGPQSPQSFGPQSPQSFGPQSPQSFGPRSSPPANLGQSFSQPSSPFVANHNPLAQTARSAQSFVPAHLSTPPPPTTPASFALPQAARGGSPLGWLLGIGLVLAAVASVGLYFAYGRSGAAASASQQRDESGEEDESSPTRRKKKAASGEKTKDTADTTAAATASPSTSKAEESKADDKKESAKSTPNLGTPKTMPGTDPVKPADTATPSQATSSPSAGKATTSPIGAGTATSSVSVPGRGKPMLRR